MKQRYCGFKGKTWQNLASGFFGGIQGGGGEAGKRGKTADDSI